MRKSPRPPERTGGRGSRLSRGGRRPAPPELDAAVQGYDKKQQRQIDVVGHNHPGPAIAVREISANGKGVKGVRHECQKEQKGSFAPGDGQHRVPLVPKEHVREPTKAGKIRGLPRKNHPLARYSVYTHS